MTPGQVESSLGSTASAAAEPEGSSSAAGSHDGEEPSGAPPATARERTFQTAQSQREFHFRNIVFNVGLLSASVTLFTEDLVLILKCRLLGLF